MKIAFNPSTVAALTTSPNNKDITFDLRGRNIFARGVKFYGTDTNTWRDIKINNVSIGSHTLDLRNGSNTTLTNTNGVVTINSTWRPVVDNLTSDSTTSSLSAKQGKVLKALIDGKSNSGHTHDDRYLKLTGGTMASNALITFADSGSWGTDKGPQGARGGLYWTGQSDYAKLYAEETIGDNLDLVIQFGDDNSNGLSIRNKANTQTSYISSSGVITTGTFKGNLDWSYITNKPATATRWPSWAEVTGKPSSFTPSTHTHGLSNSVFFLNMPSINGNAKWKEVFGYPVNYNLLLSVRINNPAPEWCVGNFGSGILYGGSDTKGFMSSAYNEPFIMWAGGNGSSDDSVPKWYIGIKGTHKSIYNLATIASEANAAYNLRHSHANKSVLDGITSALVNSWNTAYNFVSNITGTDTDKVINKWEEIVNFLAGITEDNKLNTLLNSKLSVYELANNTNVGTIKNSGIYYSTTDASSGTLTNSPFNTGFALINMTSYNDGDDLKRSRLAFNAYGEIKVSDDRDQANTAETWYNVLTSKNSGINGSTIKLNGTSITVYSSGTADGRYVKKSGDTMQGVLTIDTTNFGALTIKRNDDANGASIQFRGKSSVYGYIGLNNSTKDKQFLRWSSDTSRVYTILDTSSTYISNGKGVINGTTITQIDNATNSTNSTNARKLVNWYSARPTSLNAQFGDGSLRIFYATSSTTEGKPAEDSHILHLAWDNTGGYDAQLAVHISSGKVSTRAQNAGTWQPWKTLAFTTDIPSSLKNPYSFNVFGVVYDGSAAKTVTTSNFISQLPEGTSTITDGTMLITSYASNSGFADTNAVNVPYKRKAIHLWEYIKAKTDSLYATKVHNHDDIYVRAFRTSNDNIDSDWGQSFKTFDPVPLGTPPEQNPNISLLSIGENFNRRKQLAFIWNNDNIYYRRRINSGFTNWRILAFVDQIPTSLKNPHALTISLNGTSQGPYDGSAAKNINITPGSIGAAVSNHSHDYLVVNPADDKSFNSAYHNFQVLYAGEGNGITGKPANVDAFGLFKFRAAIGCSGQMLLANGGSLYIRSSEDAKMTNTLAWKTILDSSNYSGILDSRYYTESEVNSLLSRKLDRVNLTTGSWNPRGWNLAADYHYNGGDLSISENNGKMYVSVDGCFWQNEGQYRVLDTSDIGDIRDSVVLHQYLSAQDTAWYPLVWGGASHYNTSDSTGHIYKSYDALSWQTSSQTLYATHLRTTYIDLENNRGIFQVTSGGTSPYKGIRLPDLQSNGIGIFSRVGNSTDEGGIVLSEDTCVIYNSFDTGWGLSVRDEDITNTDISGDNTIAFGIRQDYRAYSLGGFEKAGSDNSYVLLGGGNHKLESSLNVAYSKYLTGIAITGGYNNDEGYRLIFEKTMGKWDINYGVWAIAFRHSGRGTLNIGFDTTNSDGSTYEYDIRFLGSTASRESTPFRAFYNAITKVFRIYWHYFDYTSGDIAVLRGNIKPHNGTWMTSLPNDVGTELAITYNMADQAVNADTVDGVHMRWTHNTRDTWIPVLSNGNLDYILKSELVGQYNSASASKLQTPRTIWGQSFDGTGNVSGSLSEVGNIYFKVDNSYDIGSNAVASRYIYTNWLGAKSGSKLELGANNSGYGKGLCIDTNLNVGIGTNAPAYKLDVNGQMRASGFHHSSVNSDNYILLAGGGYKSFGGNASTPIFLGYLNLYNGNDGTISSSFPCLGYSVPFTYTRGGAYCFINIPNTSFQTFHIKAAIASVNYSGAGMAYWVGNHRGEGAWWLHCAATGSNAVQVKGFHLANSNNDSWWGGNPLYSGNGAAKIITVCLFGYVEFR